ncbi:Brp/Blh family beta-carotene 15,15'-dioxygenase [Rhodanobacter sp. BL-MT-08]
MSTLLRKQSALFCVVALAMAVLAPLLPAVDNTAGLLIIGGLILLLGVPHGALDPVFASQLCGVRSAGGWLVFGLCYGAVAALVILCWQAAPTFFLLAFLLVSVVHFSGDLDKEVPLLAKALYGGTIIVLPALFHAAQIEPLFRMLVGAPSAQWITRCLHWLAWPWAAALALTAIALRRRKSRPALELAALGSLALAAPPLYAFTVFFCLMHGARHILRTLDYARDTPARRLIAVNALPMLLVAAALVVVATRVTHQPLNATIVRTIFVGLAALTAPHMMLVERVRHAGWKRPDESLPLAG